MTVKPRYNRGLRDWQNTFPITKVSLYGGYFPYFILFTFTGAKTELVKPFVIQNGHRYKTDTSVKGTPRVGPCLSLFPLFDSL